MNHLVVDGHSIAYRMHYAFPLLRTTAGLMSGAVYGFLTGLRIRRKKHPDCHVTVTWDNDAARKKAAFPEYKSERSGISVLHAQIADLKEMLACANITQAECLAEEADDVIAYLVNKYSKDGRVFVLSSDKDLMQFVKDGKVVLIRPVSGDSDKYYDEESVKKEFGVSPAGLASFLALRGDPVDGVPGLLRVRSTVIASLVNRFGDPYEVYRNIKAETLTDFERKSFEGFESQAKVNYGLTRLTGESLEPTIREGRPDPERLKEFLNKYEIRKIESESYVAMYEKESSFQSRISPELPSLFE